MIVSSDLISGHTQSCGCFAKNQTSKTHFIDITGKKYGRLTVIKSKGKTIQGKYIWLCKCDCGNIVNVVGASLIKGVTQSCGCLKKEIVSKMCGELSSQWKGGISFGPYCPKFNKAKKEEIREKYDRKCLICGKTEDETGQKLDIHHIDYRKDQGCGGRKWQLVPLCRSCHMKTNNNRTFWEFNIKWILAQRSFLERKSK